MVHPKELDSAERCAAFAGSPVGAKTIFVFADLKKVLFLNLKFRRVEQKKNSQLIAELAGIFNGTPKGT